MLFGKKNNNNNNNKSFLYLQFQVNEKQIIYHCLKGDY